MSGLRHAFHVKHKLLGIFTIQAPRRMGREDGVLCGTSCNFAGSSMEDGELSSLIHLEGILRQSFVWGV